MRTPISASLAPRLDFSDSRATEAGTARFRSRFAAQFGGDFFRTSAFGPLVSSLGIGTYLGDATDADDAAYATAIGHALASGINLIDTAINYRNQRSECAAGAAIARAISETELSRDSIVVCTKAGYIPLDRTPPANRAEYQAYVQRDFIDREILRLEDIVAGGHCLAPRFLRYCLAQSRQNLGLRTIDVFYLHNPEQQLAVVSREELRVRIKAAFAMLEDACDRGEIAVYGCATWNGLRVSADQRDHVSMADLVSIATELAGSAHRFRVVQAPLSIAMPEASRLPTQEVGGRLLSAVDAAAELGLSFVGSATLLQGQLASALPASVRALVGPEPTIAQAALGFSRTNPRVMTALVGMRSIVHVDENVATAS